MNALAGYGSTDSESEDGDATNNNLADATTKNYVDMSGLEESHCENVTASNATSATGTSPSVVEGPAARAAARSAKPKINAFSVMSHPGKRRAVVQPAATSPKRPALESPAADRTANNNSNRPAAAEQQQPSSPSLAEAAASVAAENAAASTREAEVRVATAAEAAANSDGGRGLQKAVSWAPRLVRRDYRLARRRRLRRDDCTRCVRRRR